MEPLRELVRLERCGTWLSRRLRDLGLESAVPPPFGEWLARQARAGAARTLLIHARAMEVARWLAAAEWLGGPEPSVAVAGGVGPFDLERALRWRYTAARGAMGRPRLMEKLVDEATRAEAVLPLGLCAPGTPLAGRVRRRMATTGARSLYLVWRRFHP